MTERGDYCMKWNVEFESLIYKCKKKDQCFSLRLDLIVHRHSSIDKFNAQICPTPFICQIYCGQNVNQQNSNDLFVDELILIIYEMKKKKKRWWKRRRKNDWCFNDQCDRYSGLAAAAILLLNKVIFSIDLVLWGKGRGFFFLHFSRSMLTKKWCFFFYSSSSSYWFYVTSIIQCPNGFQFWLLLPLIFDRFFFSFFRQYFWCIKLCEWHLFLVISRIKTQFFKHRNWRRSLRCSQVKIIVTIQY